MRIMILFPYDRKLLISHLLVSISPYVEPSANILSRFGIGACHFVHGKAQPNLTSFQHKKGTYHPEDYPEATHLLDCSLLLGSERRPLCGQDEALMEYYIAAFHKVYAALEELVSSGASARAAAEMH